MRCYIFLYFFKGRFPCKTRPSTRRSGLASFLFAFLGDPLPVGVGFTVTSQGERFLDPPRAMATIEDDIESEQSSRSSSTLSLSYSSSSDSESEEEESASDLEFTGTDDGVVEPYMYEPAADSDSTEVELPDSDVERLRNTEW